MSSTLMQTDLIILTNQECSPKVNGLPVPDTEICAEAPFRDACQVNWW